MYHPTTRVLTVLELLQSYRQMSGPKLAERLEVDVRSVRRYIMMLQDLGIPIETERGRYGNYRLMRGFKMPPLMAWQVEVLLEMTLEEAERQVPPTIASLKQVPNGVVLSCYAQELSWMAHFLVNLRCPLVVRQPPELREALHAVAAEIAQLADRKEDGGR